ncbi:kinesin-like protein KIN-12D [Daucus carota subsp. sativus]|uniref:kinesin-like protein KIN-12D n=1 Tax=Daucus carota subsp. sativus TaxID=79200 RepID=UPI0007F03C98|nr:PREDICTED: phragmoplast orienting kinesin 2 [Daucus carota subsp. sativus]
MMRDYKLTRRNSGKHPNVDDIENIPVNHNRVEEQEVGNKSSKVEKTPVKPPRSRYSDAGTPLKTPEKRGVTTGNRFGWAQKNELSSATNETGVDSNQYRNTPRSTRAAVRGNSSNSESNSTQCTPTKSVTKPSNQGLCLTGGQRPPPANGGARMANFAALSRGIPSYGSSTTYVNTVEVPHFEMKEDPSFWMDHNVQVLIRVRPLNNMEKSTQGYNRCLKQESSQCITWIGHPETRFTFDHVACESVEQETLFRMVGLPMVENCLSGYNSCMFAYGQTGSGKTYTMLGDIDELGVKPSPHRGMTPRIFEFLFARIRAEEESRRDERLAYSCKCSFLEIYNEQITDLLDPSSTNLLLREDTKTGVYVENLSEFEVETVADILKLLSQGSANRKVAATNMNRESSRSHSVFTCVIESRWEKDSTSNLRFARLNLVDLAGSERQKSSGAEGERLKEAANINKSLSTLGHVIMVLVDVAHAKTRHVPYRDSRLTFLLQDSLGGNSKTMIIANVSPSVCSAAETLNTLKFAQRAKLIQNNAVVNEDSSGDVTALQNQIRILKEELLALKRQNVSRSLSFGSTIVGDARQNNGSAEGMHSTDDMLGLESKSSLSISSKQFKCLETTLAGALRREQMAEGTIKQLEAEIEQLNRLVRQREEDTRCTKMMLKFREERIQRMEILIGGLMPTDTYLVEENKALSEEIQQLQAKLDKNPEVTRFALENIRLLEQLRRYQDFYEEGERDMLLTEVSESRDQLLLFLDGDLKHHNSPNKNSPLKEAECIRAENDSLHLELKKTLHELEECRSKLNSCLENNAKLSGEIDDLRGSLNDLKSGTHDDSSNIEVSKESNLERPWVEEQESESVQHKDEEMHAALMKHAQDVMDLQLELDILKIILKEERSSCVELEQKELCLIKDLETADRKASLLTKQYEDAKEELREAKSVIDALENQQLLSISEMEDLRNSNTHCMKLVHKLEHEISNLKQQGFRKEIKDVASFKHSKTKDSPLQLKLKKMHDSLDNAKRLNMCYQSDLASHASNEEEMDEVRRQVEAETAEVIVCLQEELGNLQEQFLNSTSKEEEAEGKLMHLHTELKKLVDDNEALSQNNKILCEKLADKDKQLENLSVDSEIVISEIEAALAGGCEALKDASDQLDGISGSILKRKTWISEQVGKMTKSISEKELLIEELNCCLEDANNRKNDLEVMMRSLRGAALVITEEHQKDCAEKENQIILLTSELCDKRLTIAELEKKIKYGEEELRKASKSATVAFVIVSRLSETNSRYLHTLENKNIQLTESDGIHRQKDALLLSQAVKVDEAEKLISSLSVELKSAKDECGILREQLYEEKKRVTDLEQKLDEIEGNYILETRENLAELKHGISALDSCLTIAEVANPEKDNDVADPAFFLPSDNRSEERTGTGANLKKYAVPVTDTPECLPEVGKNLHKYSSEQKRLAGGANREATVVLLREEIESAVKSLKRAHLEIANLRKENKEARDSEEGTRQVMEVIILQVLSLQEIICNFENQADSKVNRLDHKLLKMECAIKDTVTSWSRNNELFEHEVSDSKILAIQKSAEASCILAKFEEAQQTISEADYMLNELMLANKSKKVEIKELRKEKKNLTNERACLINEVQRLESSYRNLEKQAESDIVSMTELVQELEGIVLQAQVTCKENFESISSDFMCLRSQVCDSTKMVHSWIENLWSEIILKDCAMSVLHLCHMGILLETVTGLNVENGLLHHGLHESNTLLYEMREHNYKSKRDLQKCRILEGKLLADIKNNFDRISRKEDETGQLSFKIASFEEKILDLQQQEEIMVERSNNMGSELTLLMKELDNSNRNVLTTLLDQEKLFKDEVNSLEIQEEQFFVDLSAKDFHSLVLASELKQLAFQKAKLEDEQICYSTGIDRLKKDVVLLLLDMELKELILFDNEVELTHLGSELELVRMEQNGMLSEISQKEFEISELKKANDASKQEIKLLKEVSCSYDILKNELVEVTAAKKELSLQFQIQVAEVDDLKEEIISLNNECISHEEINYEALWKLSSRLEKFVSSMDSVHMKCNRIFKVLNEQSSLLEKEFVEIQKYAEGASEFLKDIDSVEILSEEVISKNSYLQAELNRKDSVLEGLLFDLKMLQESASSNKDHKDEFENLLASYEDLEDEHDEAVEKVQFLETQLQEKIDIISTLEMDVSRAHENVDSLSSANLTQTTRISNALHEKEFIEKELVQKCKDNQYLESELLEMRTALEQMNEFAESLKMNLQSVVCERDAMHAELLTLKEEFQMAQNLADENGAIAIEAQQVAETRKIYLDEKEEEVRLLERSVEELERTVNVLESKVDIVKGETELQRMQREDLEMELQSIKQKLQLVESGNDEMKRVLDDKEKRLQECLQRMQILEREIAARDTEISKCKSHISELNLHAEAQACEYKQKFKALEVMAEQVKLEGSSSTNSISSAPHSTNSSSNKLEKTGSRPRGSGSPFKCIGLGFVQQMKSERDDDELTAGRLRIEELEALAASRQKEIFMLNTRLATAESMTHDVLRDLLGLKSDMTGYASLLDDQQVQKITEKAQLHNTEVHNKDVEVCNLKKQLTEFVVERKGWLEEIDRKQAELVAAQITLEELRQHDRVLTTKNDMLMMENVNQKKKVLELELEVKKLSGQQNIQQRIHHHAKIKEENNLLKAQNEELSLKLRRSEGILSRVKEELARYRAANGKNPCIHIEEEQRLNNKLKEVEEERLQLAQKLLGLCTSILKAAGITKPASDISLPAAEEALDQLTDRSSILTKELEELKLKSRITNERNRLSELMPHLQRSPPSRSEGSRQSTPKITSQSPFLTSLDR